VKKLIIVIDIDDDLGKKAGIAGPVIGREENLNSAISLAIADPEDPDANVIFKAISVYDRMKKENEDVEIVALTGDQKLGITATSKISRQLDRVLADIPASSCFLITDGASDESVLPVIQSRLKVDGIHNIYIKQARELEKTYFVIIEKLKDPTYAKILLGGPAILILAISLMYLLALPWQLMGVLLGVILLIYGFGLNHYADRIRRAIEIKKNRSLNYVVWILLMVLTIIGAMAVSAAFTQAQDLGYRGTEVWAYAGDVLLNILFFMVLVISFARFIDAYFKKSGINQVGAIGLLVRGIAIFLVAKIGAQWIINSPSGILGHYVSFGNFLEASLAIMVASYIIAKYLDSMKADMLMSSIESGATVMSEDGSMLGSSVGVDPKEQAIIVKTQLNRIVKIHIDKVLSISPNNDIVVEE
jgi:putative membrane protein